MQVTFTSVRKFVQTTGEVDAKTRELTGNRTESRFGIFGTDLGSSFEHDGRLWFLFGDTWPSRAKVTSIAAVSRQPGTIDIFFLTREGVVNHLARSADLVWRDPVPLCGARFAGAHRIAAVSREPRHMEIFVIGEDGVLRGRWFWDTEWHDWYVHEDTAFNQTAGLAAVSRGPKHMEVFVVGTDDTLWSRWFWDGLWQNWYAHEGARFSQTTGLAAVSRDPMHMEVFAVGDDDVLRGRWFWDGQWRNWYALGEATFTQTTGLAAVSRDRKHMELFAVDKDGKVRGRWFWEGQWRNWYWLPTNKEFNQASGLAAVSPGPGLMDLFGIRDNRAPWQAWFENPGWHDWVFAETLNDSIAWTDALSPGAGLPLTFLSSDGPCARYRSPQLTNTDGTLLRTGGLSVPVSGFSANGKMYVFYSDADMVRTRLAVAEHGDPLRLQAKYETSSRFINIACKVVQPGHPGLGSGLPFAGPALLMWGTGVYRHSNVYLAAVPLHDVEKPSEWRFYKGGTEPWTSHEAQANPVFTGEVGELSVTWIDALGAWLALYNGFTPIYGRVAPTPWGPWSDAKVVIKAEDGHDEFVHKGGVEDGLYDPGRKPEGGGLYGPYVIERFTTRVAPRLARIYFLLSTWNPYNTVLMTAKVSIE